MLAAEIADGLLATVLGVVLVSVIGLGAWIVRSQFSLEKGQVGIVARLVAVETLLTGLRKDLADERSSQAGLHQQSRVELGGERVERVEADATTDARVEKLRDKMDEQTNGDGTSA